MSPDEVAARIEIQDALMRYSRGVDRCDPEMIRSAFHPGATVEQGVFTGTSEDWAESAVGRAEGKTLVGQHHVTNVYIVVDGETANVEGYFLMIYPIFADDSGEETMALYGGRFLDRFRRIDGTWRISARQVVMDWTRDELSGVPLVRPFLYGTAGPADPSYAFFSGQGGGAPEDAPQ